jgi:septal ring factor EnvC (AmiA/AmiB activator)
MFVDNKNFQEHYADEKAAEVELVNGREAAAQFRKKVEADRAAKAASARDKEKISPSAMYQRSGDRITINGNLATGYYVRGNQLVEHSTGRPTHMRTGVHWVPLNNSHPTIYDP